MCRDEDQMHGKSKNLSSRYRDEMNLRTGSLLCELQAVDMPGVRDLAMHSGPKKAEKTCRELDLESPLGGAVLRCAQQCQHGVPFTDIGRTAGTWGALGVGEEQSGRGTRSYAGRHERTMRRRNCHTIAARLYSYNRAQCRSGRRSVESAPTLAGLGSCLVNQLAQKSFRPLQDGGCDARKDRRVGRSSIDRDHRDPMDNAR
jgi:hypothetical protein